MGPLIPAIIAGGATLGGAAVSALGQADANEENAKQAQANREFQERMSSTAWQRGVADMRKAGLNPALAYEKGGASAPSGSTAQMQNTMMGAASSASQAAQAATNVVMTKAQVAQTLASADKTSAEATQIRDQMELQRKALELLLEERRSGTALNQQRLATERQETQGRLHDVSRRYYDALRAGQELDYRSQLNPMLLRQQGQKTDIVEATREALISQEISAAALAAYGLPGARNRAAAAETFIGKYILPYLGPLGHAVGSGRQILRDLQP